MCISVVKNFSMFIHITIKKINKKHTTSDDPWALLKTSRPCDSVVRNLIANVPAWAASQSGKT